MPGLGPYWEGQRNAFALQDRMGETAVTAFNDRRTRQQNMQAGEALSGDDPGAAVNVFRAAGRLDDANTLETQNRARDAEMRAQHAREAQLISRGLRQRLTSSLGTGDPRGDAAGSAGADPGAVFDSFAPQLASMGTSYDQIQYLREQFVADPQGFLDNMDALTDRELRVIQGRNGSYRTLDMNTGAQVSAYDAPQATGGGTGSDRSDLIAAQAELARARAAAVRSGRSANGTAPRGRRGRGGSTSGPRRLGPTLNPNDGW